MKRHLYTVKMTRITSYFTYAKIFVITSGCAKFHLQEYHKWRIQSKEGVKDYADIKNLTVLSLYVIAFHRLVSRFIW